MQWNTIAATYFRERFKEKEHDRTRGITSLPTGHAVMMASSRVVAQYKLGEAGRQNCLSHKP